MLQKVFQRFACCEFLISLIGLAVIPARRKRYIRPITGPVQWTPWERYLLCAKAHVPSCRRFIVCETAAPSCGASKIFRSASLSPKRNVRSKQFGSTCFYLSTLPCCVCFCFVFLPFPFQSCHFLSLPIPSFPFVFSLYFPSPSQFTSSFLPFLLLGVSWVERKGALLAQIKQCTNIIPEETKWPLIHKRVIRDGCRSRSRCLGATNTLLRAACEDRR